MILLMLAWMLPAPGPPVLLAELTVIVVDRATDDPVPEALVIVRSAPFRAVPGFQRFLFTCATSATGTCATFVAVGQPYRVTVDADGFRVRRTAVFRLTGNVARTLRLRVP